MKKIMLLIALCGSFLALTPQNAQAHCEDRRVAYRCGACGESVYQELRIVGYDHCRRPIYRWVNVGHSCRRHHSHHDYGNEINVGGFRFRF